MSLTQKHVNSLHDRAYPPVLARSTDAPLTAETPPPPPPQQQPLPSSMQSSFLPAPRFPVLPDFTNNNNNNNNNSIKPSLPGMSGAVGEIASFHVQAPCADGRLHARPLLQQSLPSQHQHHTHTTDGSSASPSATSHAFPSSPENCGGGGLPQPSLQQPQQHHHLPPQPIAHPPMLQQQQTHNDGSSASPSAATYPFPPSPENGGIPTQHLPPQQQLHQHSKRPPPPAQTQTPQHISHHHQQQQPQHIRHSQHHQPQPQQPPQQTKEFPCTYPGCLKAFDRRYNLSVHYRRHTDAMPYSCKVAGCNQRFKWRSSQSHHMKTRHQGAVISTGRGANRRTIVLGQPTNKPIVRGHHPHIPQLQQYIHHHHLPQPQIIHNSDVSNKNDRPAPPHYLPSLHINNINGHGMVHHAIQSGNTEEGQWSTTTDGNITAGMNGSTVCYSNTQQHPVVGMISPSHHHQQQQQQEQHHSQNRINAMTVRSNLSQPRVTISINDSGSDRGSAEAVVGREEDVSAGTLGMSNSNSSGHIGGGREVEDRIPFRRMILSSPDKRQRGITICEDINR